MRPTIRCDLINGPFGDPVVLADIMFGRRAFLFDMGNIRAIPARKLLRVSHAFVSHAHMDHFADFDHLLRLLLGRNKTLHLHGPAGFLDRVEHRLLGYTWNLLHRYDSNLVLHATEVCADATLRHARFQSRHGFRREQQPDSLMQDGLLMASGGLTVRCATLDHDTPSLGFVLDEPVHVNIWKPRLDPLHLAVGSWLHDLKEAVIAGKPDTTPITAARRQGDGGGTVVVPLGDLRHVVQTVRGQRIAYIVDVRGHEQNMARIADLIRGADLLFIECPFLEADIAHAARKNHLTARQAGLIARRAGVAKVIPCHLSPRYADRADAVLAEVQQAFRGEP